MKHTPAESKQAIFVDLVYRNQGIIHKICRLYAAEEDREDLEQEIIYQLWKSYPSFRGESRFQTWMYRVALNTAMLGLRARKWNYTPLSETKDEPSHEWTEEPEGEDRIRQLYDHISKLHDLDKSIIFLYLEGCSYEEIANITGINSKNVSVRLVRIREKLRRFFHMKNPTP